MADEVRLVETRAETPSEAALRDWFDKQVLASPDNIESAARLIIGLTSTLLGVWYGVLNIAADKLPSYLKLFGVREFGVATILLMLVSLWAALAVVLPFRLAAQSTRPDEQAEAFKNMLQTKSMALRVATIAFGLGLASMGLVLIITLSSVA